jgi:UDP-glucose 4-epimerase
VQWAKTRLNRLRRQPFACKLIQNHQIKTVDDMGRRVLITGGAGFIGSHTCLVLLEQGHELVVLDSFDNSSPEALRRVQELADSTQLTLVEGDVRDPSAVDQAFSTAGSVDGVIHFAGLKAVGESVANPLLYWDVNVNGSRVLAAAMERHGCRTLVFSSTSTAYGEPETFPLRENMPTAPVHPYAQTKVAVEQMLAALCRSGSWQVACLRYFNPVGAHPSGRIGEDPLGIPNNLFPFITQVAAGRRERLRVFGQDYPTPDGTGIRDYLHVMDLAEAHGMALDHLFKRQASEPLTLNIGTGRGLSVLDVVHGFEQATGLTIPYEVVQRRPGDVPRLEACPQTAQTVLGWSARRSLEEMCRDGWAWQQANPTGYRPNP